MSTSDQFLDLCLKDHDLRSQIRKLSSQQLMTIIDHAFDWLPTGEADDGMLTEMKSLIIKNALQVLIYAINDRTCSAHVLHNPKYSIARILLDRHEYFDRVNHNFPYWRLMRSVLTEYHAQHRLDKLLREGQSIASLIAQLFQMGKRERLPPYDIAAFGMVLRPLASLLIELNESANAEGLREELRNMLDWSFVSRLREGDAYESDRQSLYFELVLVDSGSNLLPVDWFRTVMRSIRCQDPFAHFQGVMGYRKLQLLLQFFLYGSSKCDDVHPHRSSFRREYATHRELWDRALERYLMNLDVLSPELLLSQFRILQSLPTDE